MFVIFRNEATLLLGGVRSHRRILPGASFHVFEGAESAIIDQFNIHQGTIFVSVALMVALDCRSSTKCAARTATHGVRRTATAGVSCLVRLDQSEINLR